MLHLIVPRIMPGNRMTETNQALMNLPTITQSLVIGN